MSILNKFFVLLLLSLLTGCITYQPKSLTTDIEITKLSALNNDANFTKKISSFQHERLSSVTLNFKKPLNAQELAIIAVLLNPNLKALRSKEGVQQAQVFNAGLLPDPKVNIDFSKYLHQTNPVTSPLTNGYGSGLSFDLMSLITRNAKLNVANAKYKKVHYDIAWQEWLLANLAELQATRIYFFEQQISLLKQSQALSKKLLDISYQNLQRHDLKIDAYATIKSSYLNIQNQLQTIQRQLKQVKLQLNQTLGISPSENLSIGSPETKVLKNLQYDQLVSVANHSRLDLIALQAGYESQEQILHQEILRQFPNFVLGVRRAQDNGDLQTIGIGASFSIPVFNGNKGNIAIAKATREQLYQEYKARLFQTQANIALLVTDVACIKNNADSLSEGLPSLRNAADLMYQGLKRGSVTELAYQNTRSSLLSKEITLLTLEQIKSEQMIALQIEIGRPWREVIKHVAKK